MGDFPGPWWVPPIGLGGLVIGFVWLVITGWLIPRWTYKDLVADRDYWRETSMTLMAQNQELMVGVRVATHVAEALPIPGGGSTHNEAVAEVDGP